MTRFRAVSRRWQAAGVVDNKSEVYEYQPALACYEKLVKLRDDPKTAAKDVANAARLCCIISKLFGENMKAVHFLFARDWCAASRCPLWISFGPPAPVAPGLD